ncbi:MAG: hypothetical protein HOP33_09915 [Verrucomicrobia bacterium]|nr:hypothetical protein [Verrucomicrobiota bacterium]
MKDFNPHHLKKTIQQVQQWDARTKKCSIGGTEHPKSDEVAAPRSNEKAAPVSRSGFEFCPARVSARK